jgi:hypothetical protein
MQGGLFGFQIRQDDAEKGYGSLIVSNVSQKSPVPPNHCVDLLALFAHFGTSEAGRLKRTKPIGPPLFPFRHNAETDHPDIQKGTSGFGTGPAPFGDAETKETANCGGLLRRYAGQQRQRQGTVRLLFAPSPALPGG